MPLEIGVEMKTIFLVQIKSDYKHALHSSLGADFEKKNVFDAKVVTFLFSFSRRCQLLMGFAKSFLYSLGHKKR